MILTVMLGLACAVFVVWGLSAVAQAESAVHEIQALVAFCAALLSLIGLELRRRLPNPDNDDESDA